YAVPDREREDAVEVIDNRIAELLVEVQDDLGVGVAAEAMRLVLEKAAELAVVVDLAVEDDDSRAVLVGNWLVPAAEVDDRQPAAPEPDLRFEVDPLVVGATMCHHARHRAERLAIDRRRAFNANDSANPAHT